MNITKLIEKQARVMMNREEEEEEREERTGIGTGTETRTEIEGGDESRNRNRNRKEIEENRREESECIDTDGKLKSNTKTGDGEHRSIQGLYADAPTPRVREVTARERRTTIREALGARPKEGSLAKSRGDIGEDRSRSRSGCRSKGRSMPPPAPPGCRRQDSPIGIRGMTRRGMRERDRMKMEGSIRAWLSRGEKPELESRGKRRKEGGLSGERDEPSPTAKSPACTRDRPQDQSGIGTLKGDITDNAD